MLMLGSCTGKNGGEAGASDADSTAICSYDIVGDWAIERIVAGDTLSLTPVKTDSGLPQTITFGEDGNYGVKTNCNSLGGSYTYTGDSLRFGDSFSTLMACTDMQAEMLLGRILPEVTVPDFCNDSVLRLNTDAPGTYIELRKKNK